MKAGVFMYYRINNDNIEEVDRAIWKESDKGIAVFNEKQWREEPIVNSHPQILQNHNNIHFCKLECFEQYLFGAIHIPSKGNLKAFNFVFYILKGKIIFVDDTEIITKHIERLSALKIRTGYTLERFVYDILVSLVSEDLVYLESLEREITKLEENIISWKVDNFNQRLLKIKKEISHLYRYYSQLTNLGAGLYENEMDFFGKDDVATFKVFSERAGRLQDETQVLREYAMQVQEVYQSEIGIRQNDVMKVLTVVTTIFLPLTLIVGWYGMNFINMPELGWKYGYPLVILLSVGVIFISIWIFKRKKLW